MYKEVNILASHLKEIIDRLPKAPTHPGDHDRWRIVLRPDVKVYVNRNAPMMPQDLAHNERELEFAYNYEKMDWEFKFIIERDL